MVVFGGFGVFYEIVNLQLYHSIIKIDEYVSTHDTEKQRGSGIGLILCKEVVAKNGGKINMVSKEDEGSTFKFTIPISA